MISHIDITGVRYTPDDVTLRYVRKKIGGLERYVPRHARKSLKVEVKLKEVNRAYGNKYECEVLFHVPNTLLTAKDSTLNMLAAVDIVEAKMRTQLKKYKDDATDHDGRHNFLGRLKRRVAQPEVEY
jgi:putative sigma-54 modulation protein